MTARHVTINNITQATLRIDRDYGELYTQITYPSGEAGNDTATDFLEAYLNHHIKEQSTETLIRLRDLIQNLVETEEGQKKLQRLHNEKRRKEVLEDMGISNTVTEIT